MSRNLQVRQKVRRQKWHFFRTYFASVGIQCIHVAFTLQHAASLQHGRRQDKRMCRFASIPANTSSHNQTNTCRILISRLILRWRTGLRHLMITFSSEETLHPSKTSLYFPRPTYIQNSIIVIEISRSCTPKHCWKELQADANIIGRTFRMIS